ncbi:MAG: hypothetical protein KGD64_05080 [Candidatus Heimdallarchaeota archaeon]|nr:hypothetical protein [Candidatus Heimdallarchaeota archaeon]
MSKQQIQTDEMLSEFKLNYILVDSLKFYYGIVDGLSIEPIWIPKSAVTNDYSIKQWLINQFNEGDTTLKRMGKKLTQTSLVQYVCH